MNLGKLESFACAMRTDLMQMVAAKLDAAIAEDSLASRENPSAVKELKDEIAKSSREAVIERVSYTWFNRFCAFRYMDVNHYTSMGIVSTAIGATRPEILAEAAAGNFDTGMFADPDLQHRITDILSGTRREVDPFAAAYRTLFIAACNAWEKPMPFMFEKLNDWTELLLPTDLLSENSLLARVREALDAESCSSVEVIGWLYQFYISEKKSAIEEGFKRNVKASAENIPAVTQLFTPHWIVKYLVQNSLGRLWLALHPDSALKSIMEYYVPGDQEHPTPVPTDIRRPEDIRVCDPCCGSAHMLIYAFEILYFIYEENGYAPAEIPGLILEHNLYGLELDARAAALSSFALMMMARSKYPRFFRNPKTPNICALQAVKFNPGEISAYMDRIGRDLFTVPFATTLEQFEEADNFGSLIVPALESAAGLEEIFKSKDLEGDLLYRATHQKVLAILHQAAYLSCRYHVAVTNPPYLGGKNMNSRLKAFAEENYPMSKSDLFAMFIERCAKMCVPNGYVSMVTMQSWMFLSSFEELRKTILDEKTILTMAHLGAHGFDSIGGEIVSTTAFCFANSASGQYFGAYFKLVDGQCESEKETKIRHLLATPDGAYRVSTDMLRFNSGGPIAYWLTDRMRRLFGMKTIKDFGFAGIGMRTGDNHRFLRLWHEVSQNLMHVGCPDALQSIESHKRWIPYNKGGEFRKWFGNNDYVVNWFNNGYEIKEATLAAYPTLSWDNLGWKISNEQYYFKPGITWSGVTTNFFSCRCYDEGFIFDSGANGLFALHGEDRNFLAGLLNAQITDDLLGAINPTINTGSGTLNQVPVPEIAADGKRIISERVDQIIAMSRADWNAYERSWDFRCNPLVSQGAGKLSESYTVLRENWIRIVTEMKHLEEQNNTDINCAFSVEGDVDPIVPWNRVSLTCNSWYRYGKIASTNEGDFPLDNQCEARLKTDTVKELISYAVGCMMGRYSLDKPGLILADQGATEADYYAKIGVDKERAKFTVDEDGIIPILDTDWFDDDIVVRFREFIRVTFGTEHLHENMAWIEEALGKDIRSYFTTDFYADHLKRYQNRPIYWLFQSPRGAFRAIVYLHRYRPETVGVVLQYVRSLQGKLTSRLESLERQINDAATPRAIRTQSLREKTKVARQLHEIDSYEREVLYPLSTRRLEIDLDDGVKVNYPKFGAALKRVPALEA